MTDFPPNSYKSREAPADDKKVESVVEGRVTRRKKSPGKRFGELFFTGDTDTVTRYVLLDVLLPAVKDMIYDGFSTLLDQKLFGETRGGTRRPGRRPGSSGGSSNYVSYNRYNTREREDPRPRMSQQARATHSFDEVVLDTRIDAENVLNKLEDLITRYDAASVSDLYNLINETSSHADEKWGWTDIRDAAVHRTRGGYLLDLPKPQPID